MVRVVAGAISRREQRFSPTQVVVFSFAAIILTGALLLTLPVSARDGSWTDFLTALFTSTSAVCVTGLVVVDTATHYSTFGQAVILLLIQIGGLGWMTVATMFALFLRRKIGFRQRVVMQEALNQYTMEGVVRLAKGILLTTAVLEGIGFAILALRFSLDFGIKRGLYYGLFHSVSAFNNAGFDVFGDVFGKFSSMTHYVADPVVGFTVTSLVILGGIGFPVIGEVLKERRFSRFSLHTKLVLTVTAILIVVGTVLIMLFEWSNPKTLQPLSTPAKVLSAYFQSVTPRTAGFNTLDIAGMRSPTQLLEVLLMFIGASPAGTGGGVKTSTFGVLVLAVWAMIRGRDEVDCWHRRIPWSQIYKALCITFLAFSLVTGVTWVLLAMEKTDMLKTLFETVSAFGTVGLSMGLTPDLTGMGRILIILTMFAGRVGPLSLAMAIWQRQSKAVIRRPEDKVLLG